MNQVKFICGVFYLFTVLDATLSQGTYVSTGLSQSYSAGSDGICSYANQYGEIVVITYYIDNDGYEQIAEIDPPNIPNPYDELTLCLENTQNVITGVNELLGPISPGVQTGSVAVSSGSGGGVSVSSTGGGGVSVVSSSGGGVGGGSVISTSPLHKRNTFEVVNTGVRVGGGSGSAGVCSYLDTKGNNVQVRFGFTEEGNLIFPGTSKRNYGNKRKQLEDCRGANTQLSEGLYNQLTQTQVALQNQFANIQSQIFNSFDRIFSSLGKKK